MKYHLTINSFYVEISKIRYRGPLYWKVNLKYYTKPSGTFMTEEKNIKIYKHVMQFWEPYND